MDELRAPRAERLLDNTRGIRLVFHPTQGAPVDLTDLPGISTPPGEPRNWLDPAPTLMGNFLRFVDQHGLPALEQLATTAPAVPGGNVPGDASLPGTPLPPVDGQEVWAAGLTYERSRRARVEESDQADYYDKVYAADRPELFMKAQPDRTVGPDAVLYLRPDAQWQVVEPELAVILAPSMRVVGYTIGNDLTARDIEAENPLYLPQAKVWERSCSLGPALVLAEAVTNVAELDIWCRVTREEATTYEAEVSVGRMVRSIDSLIAYLGYATRFPNGVVLLTGTGIVPPDSFTLQPGDEVEITITGLGRLRNRIEIVPSNLRPRSH